MSRRPTSVSPCERARERIAGPGTGRDHQTVVRWRGEEPGRPVEDRGPDAPRLIGGAQDDESPLGGEGARHRGDLAVDATPDASRIDQHTGSALDLQLPLVIRAHQKNPQEGAPATGAARPAAPVGL